LYREIVGRLAAVGIPAGDILIVLREVPLENWGVRGGQPAWSLFLEAVGLSLNW